MKYKHLALSVVIGAVALTGCTIKPMLIHEPTPFMIKAPVSQQSLETAIVKAALSKDWQVVNKAPGKITLTYPGINTPRYKVINTVVRVEYDTKTYRIVHVSERGLEKAACVGEPETQCIHRNYNRWIANLDLQIQKQCELLNR